MPQEPVELILVRHWASYIAIPIWITDVAGNLIFYNEPAEELLGVRFDEAGELPADRLADLFFTQDLDGSPLPADRLPIVVALNKGIPAHRKFRYRAVNGPWHVVGVTALPLIGQGDRQLGVLTAFWEEE